ncbi:fatty acyl-AMP ligase [Streptomyces sp. NBC_00091]|uniref:fatty acyl-AMP ligase n=1 Tax=Streptomyces sp. NBC_00091 TaxID=2975648 RepID=UPI00224FBEF6|nr:fatty acyl-AMP ligase [Streptomyces sp. NBC_00091]MCX5381006.1 fatty acyl-AMP ligase [Streptomyces sp. NBC_00091]
MGEQRMADQDTGGGDASLTHRIRRRAADGGADRWCTFGDGTPEGEQRLSHTELDARAAARAAWLQGLGAEGSRALLMYPAGLEFLAAFLGCLYSRTVAVPAPLPLTDPRALERAARIVADAGITLLLTDAGHLDLLTGWLRESGLDDRVTCLATDAAELPAPEAWTAPRLDRDTLAYVQYTSGSTSAPKGIAITHGNLLHNLESIRRFLGSPRTATIAGWLPHHHDMGLVGMLLEPLYAGFDLAFTAPATFVLRPAKWLRAISRHRADVIVAPDFGYDWCLRRIRDADLDGLDLSCVRVALNGAEPVRPATLAAFAERLAPCGFDPKAWAPVYGMAEATLLISGPPAGSGAHTAHFDAGELERHRAVPAAPGTGRELVSCGPPLRTDLRIVDPATRTPLPDGHVGEIWAAGGSVASSFRPPAEGDEDPFQGHTATGAGPYLRTGDLGFLRDGELYVTGRLKDVLIVNGRNLYPQDIEAAAQRLHPAAGTAAAFSVDIHREHVVVVQEARGSLDGAEHTRRLLAALAGDFGIRGANVVLVPRGGVERTTSGKIRRRRMRELFLAGRLTPLHADLEPELHDLMAALAL